MKWHFPLINPKAFYDIQHYLDHVREECKEFEEATDPEKKAKNFEQIKAARAGVDRKKQAAAASAGQKAWWVELRKDPVRYAEYINRRRESLLANLRHRKRGAEEPLHD